MPIQDQGINLERYMFIPRTLTFITREDKVLLIRGAPNKRLWANKYNGIGGHIDPGEDILSAAKRELFEETGLEVTDFRLCGILVIDTDQNPGICLFIFTGVNQSGEINPSEEGQAEWIPFDQVANLPCVEDLPVLLPAVLSMRKDRAVFSARSFYNLQGKLELIITD